IVTAHLPGAPTQAAPDWNPQLNSGSEPGDPHTGYGAPPHTGGAAQHPAPPGQYGPANHTGTPPAGAQPPATPAPSAPAPHILRRDDYTWRPDGYLTSHTTTHPGTTPDHRQYTLDPIGRITQITRNGALAEHYTYDKLSNITSGGVITPDATTPAPGHPTAPGQPGAHQRYPSPPGTPPNPAAPQQHSPAHTRREYHNNLLIRDGRHHYHYDPAGRLIRKTTTRISRKPDVWHYRYNAFDQLTDVYTPDGQWWHYTYDALGRRTTKQHLTDDGVPRQRTGFAWDGSCIAEQASLDGTTRWSFLPGTYTPLTQTTTFHKSESLQFGVLISDVVGTPRQIVEPRAAKSFGIARIDLWGRVSWQGAGHTTLRFPGQQYDAESGLHYNVNRTYDPATGGYLTTDPLGLAPASNPRSYPHNPLVWNDPLGLTPDCGEVFYRTMSEEHYQELLRTGRLQATGETFISPTQAFSESYEGRLVRFVVESGTQEALADIGVRDASRRVREIYPDMPEVFKGWADVAAHFKGEGDNINIGLGRGAALEIFNNSIVRFSEVAR
ncbi:RHS repeat-associated core domain-containing protein, partial [Nocardia cyriacigeorgica]